jgi:hypothetical protein
MRFFSILLISCIICATGCGGNGASNAPASNAPAPYTAPTSYAAATMAAVAPSLALPVGPWDCEPVKVVGTPGTVLTRHSTNGVLESYTAQANGNFTSANGLSLDMLVPPRVTLWFTMTSPTNAVVEWSGAQFTSVDNTGATWTSPENASYSHPQTVIRVTVAPSGNG